MLADGEGQLTKLKRRVSMQDDAVEVRFGAKVDRFVLYTWDVHL